MNINNEIDLNNIFQREKALIGNESFQTLQNTTILLVGLGGVGSYCFESLIRLGINNLIIVDNDKYEETNINRQLYATIPSIGNYKTDVSIERAKIINPNAIIKSYNSKIQNIKLDDIIPKNITNFYIVDCIDDVEGKILLYKYAVSNNIKIISCMGTGNKIHASMLKISTLKKTNTCPLSKKLRKLVGESLGKQSLDKINVVYSEENPINNNTSFVSSISYVPASAGLLMSEYIVNDILHIQ